MATDSIDMYNRHGVEKDGDRPGMSFIVARHGSTNSCEPITWTTPIVSKGRDLYVVRKHSVEQYIGEARKSDAPNS
ncbi:MAG: hypothetical protein QX198_12465 [Methylococcaceae bacterium]